MQPTPRNKLYMTREDFPSYNDEIARVYRQLHPKEEDKEDDMLCKDVTFCVTEACNLACTYCYECHKTSRRMSWETAKRIVDGLFEGEFVDNSAPAIILDFIVTPYVPVYSGDKMVSCIFGGVLVGASLAVVFMRGSTTGGGDIAAKLLQKYRPHMQTGTAVMATDMVIILLSMVVFQNIESGLYGLINMVVSTYVIDVILYGMNKSTMITVITSKPQEIADALMDALERGCTLIKSRGAYAKQEGESVICVVDRKQFYKAKKVIYGIDKQAFVIVSEAKEVYGEGFLDSDWEV